MDDQQVLRRRKGLWQTKQLPGTGEEGKAGSATGGARGDSQQTTQELGTRTPRLADKLCRGGEGSSVETALKFLRGKKHTSNLYGSV